VKNPALSILVIAKDEALRLPAFFKALECLKPLAYEVVFLENGSSDSTPALARRFGAKVKNVAWQGYGATRNQGVKDCKADWVLCLDADERVTPALAENIRRLLSAPEKHGYALCRLNHFLGEPIRHGGWHPDWQLRLFKKGAAWFNTRPVHEGMAMAEGFGPAGRIKGDLLHDSYPSLQGYFARLNRYTTLQAEELMQKKGARPGLALLRCLLDPPWVLVKMLLFKRGFLDGRHGWVLAALSASSTFWKYAKWWHASWAACGGKAGIPWVVGGLRGES
jgi:glycosyltransferase involved in cell wall biosynthesis